MEMTILLSGQDARGRNGWFQAREAIVRPALELVSLVSVGVRSKQLTYPGPIYFLLTPAEAEELGAVLIKMGRYVETNQKVEEWRRKGVAE